MAKHILALNGPPGCGKDTLAALLVERDGYVAVSMKDAVLHAAQKGLPELETDILQAAWAPGVSRDVKDTHNKELGTTPRQLLIDFSSRTRALYGAYYFVKQTADEINSLFAQGHTKVLITDLGFDDELDFLTRVFGDDVAFVLLKIRRDNCSFANDSRRWLAHDKCVEVVNDDTVDTMYERVWAKLNNHFSA